MLAARCRHIVRVAGNVERMLHPVGQLPRNVYWRRRLGLLAMFLAIAVIVRFAFFGGESRADDDAGAPIDSPTTASSPAESTPSESVPSEPATSEPTTAPTTPSKTPSKTPDPSPTQTQVGRHTLLPADAPAPPVATTPPPPPTPKCEDGDLSLTVTTEQQSYAVGTQPVFVLKVTNNSDETCQRDLGARNREVLVYARPNRLWGNNDCGPAAQSDPRTLKAHESATVRIAWDGMTAIPGCAILRQVVGAGGYEVTATVGTVQSEQAQLVLT